MKMYLQNDPLLNFKIEKLIDELNVNEQLIYDTFIDEGSVVRDSRDLETVNFESEPYSPQDPVSSLFDRGE